MPAYAFPGPLGLGPLIKAFSFLNLLWICFWPFNFLRQIKTYHCEGNNTFFYLAPGLRWLKCSERLNPSNINWWVLYVTKQTSERLPARRSMTLTKSLNYYPLCCELWSSIVLSFCMATFVNMALMLTGMSRFCMYSSTSTTLQQLHNNQV